LSGREREGGIKRTIASVAIGIKDKPTVTAAGKGSRSVCACVCTRCRITHAFIDICKYINIHLLSYYLWANVIPFIIIIIIFCIYFLNI